MTFDIHYVYKEHLRLALPYACFPILNVHLFTIDMQILIYTPVLKRKEAK